jgi:hypothetical protein
MLLVGFEPTIPAFEQAKTVHAIDRAATVISVSGKAGKLLQFNTNQFIN